MRAGINYEILTEATLQGTLDSDGKPLSLAEQDMVAIKATMRLGFLWLRTTHLPHLRTVFRHLAN